MTDKSKEELHTVRYEKNGDFTLTPCPHGDNSYVGSCGCISCPYHVSVDREKQEVTCGG